MAYIIKSGAKSIGYVKRKSKKNINKILAREYKKENRISILKVAKKRR